MQTNINIEELNRILEMTPTEQNIMLVGKHGIGKSEILTEYFANLGIEVVTLFLGQMSDPGDLIGLPRKDEESDRTVFMPPYWFPKDDSQPIVLFLDELNRARPEILQTIMDLSLNRRLAGRALPKGSRIISAINDGEQYQLTDLDPALVSRFNIYHFRPSASEWLLWAKKNNIDERIIRLIEDEPLWLDGDKVQLADEDSGLEKTPDRRAWKRVSDIINGKSILGHFEKKLIAGIVGSDATAALVASASTQTLVEAKDILKNFDVYKETLESYCLHDVTTVSESVLRALETMRITQTSKDKYAANLTKYVKWLSNRKEPMAHIVSMFEGTSYPKAQQFIVLNAPEVFNMLTQFVDAL